MRIGSEYAIPLYFRVSDQVGMDSDKFDFPKIHIELGQIKVESNRFFKLD